MYKKMYIIIISFVKFSCVCGNVEVVCLHVELWLCSTHSGQCGWTGGATEETQPRQADEVCA